MTIPNYLTLLRILIVPLFVSMIVRYDSGHEYYRLLAVVCFFVAVATDALDGFIARRFHMQSDIGAFLDPFADKLLVVSGLVAITFSNAFQLKPPDWIVIVIVFRDLFILFGLFMIFFLTNKVSSRPNFLGKITTVLQMCVVGSILIKWSAAPLFWYAAVGSTILSIFSYIIREGNRLNHPS